MSERLPRAFGARLGEVQDEAYAEAFGAKITDGYSDHGKDLAIDDPETPAVQIRSSIEGAKFFLAESLRREEFIPICVGEPGSREEMLDSIRQFGAWIGRDIPGRNEVMKKIAIVRDLCHNKERVLKNLLTDLG